MELIMLGTGNAMVTRCYNTCFILRSSEQHLLVDGGGGNTLLCRLQEAHIDWRDLRTIFVTHKHIDHILGTVHQKDFYVGCGVTDKPLEDILSPAVFVLENEPISLLLKKLQLAKTQMAVVVDEYGGTCGIVTMEDILEELVGEIWDEHDEEEVFIRKIAPRTYLVDAAMDFDDFAEFFHLSDETEMTSVSGWVMEKCDRVPDVGDRFDYGDLHVLVTRVDNHRTCEIQVTQDEGPAETAEPNE